MIWDTETGHLNHIIEGHFGGVNCVCFSHDWKLVASCSDDQTVKIRVSESSQIAQNVEEHQAPVTCVNYSPDGRRVVSGSMDNTLIVWDAEFG